MGQHKKTIAVIADDEGRFDKWVKEKIKPKETILKYDGYRCETENGLYVWCDLTASILCGLQIDDIIDISTRAEILYTRITPIYKSKEVTYTLAGIKFKLDKGE